jgi:hypothetical protein
LSKNPAPEPFSITSHPNLLDRSFELPTSEALLALALWEVIFFSPSFSKFSYDMPAVILSDICTRLSMEHRVMQRVTPFGSIKSTIMISCAQGHRFVFYLDKTDRRLHLLETSKGLSCRLFLRRSQSQSRITQLVIPASYRYRL